MEDLKALGLKVKTMADGSGADYYSSIDVEGDIGGRVFRGDMSFDSVVDRGRLFLNIN